MQALIEPCRRLLPAAMLMLAAMVPAQAQDYPSKPVRIIVPFAPGGSADVFGRFLAQRLQDALGQTFVIDNRPGAGSVIGTDAVAKSAPVPCAWRTWCMCAPIYSSTEPRVCRIDRVAGGR